MKLCQNVGDVQTRSLMMQLDASAQRCRPARAIPDKVVVITVPPPGIDECNAASPSKGATVVLGDIDKQACSPALASAMLTQAARSLYIRRLRDILPLAQAH